MESIMLNIYRSISVNFRTWKKTFFSNNDMNGNKGNQYLLPGRLQNIMASKQPDYARWGDSDSYEISWGTRSELVATLVQYGRSVLEIGVGTGVLKSLLRNKCIYTGADLHPLDKDTISLNLDNDQLPSTKFDYIILLGVFEYLHFPELAVEKLCQSQAKLIISYCCRAEDGGPKSGAPTSRGCGWVNDFSEVEFTDLFHKHNYETQSTIFYNSSIATKQLIFVFEPK